MNKGLSFIAAVASLWAFYSCSNRPDYVIPPEKMAELMADLNMGEAVTDVERRQYRENEPREEFKSAIYEKHGVTGEQVDTSLSWYGHNISQYIEICDRSVEILEARLSSVGTNIVSNSVSAHGDSVDIWPYPSYIHVRPQDASSSLTFHFEQDENREIGDIYTWRAKFDNISSPVEWGIISEYADGMIETLNTSFNSNGWQEINFYTDSTKTLSRIYGYLKVDENNSFIDSLSLIRKRKDEELYTHRYRQKKIEGLKGRLSLANDSISKTMSNED